jgi:hypothetical protein
LQPHGARTGRGLLIEQRAPLLGRQEHDIVRRRLRLSAARQPNCLEHRILVRQIDNARHHDIDRTEAGPIDHNPAAHRGVKIGRCLLRQQGPGQGA